jgi:GNAT superfamily N-acetyltransferase
LKPRLRISRLGPEEWRIYRDVRLAALLDAPHAFGSTLEDERRVTPAGWRRRLADRAQYVARLDDEVVGTAGGVTTARGGGAELVSMWVHPTARGQGVGDGLVATVLAWAAGRGCDQVRLWVSEGTSMPSGCTPATASCPRERSSRSWPTSPGGSSSKCYER